MSKNTAASFRQRLLNLARERHEDFDKEFRLSYADVGKNSFVLHFVGINIQDHSWNNSMSLLLGISVTDPANS